MSKEDKSILKDSNTKQAMEILKALNHFEYPEEVGDVENWLSKTKPLQSLVKKLCERDKTGKITLECINLLFDLIATNGQTVSPAIWDVLEIVDDVAVSQFFTENLKKETTLRLKNSLNALLHGVCQCGHRVPVLQTWCFSLIKHLEDKQKYSILLAVSHSVLYKLLNCIALPYSRKTVYPVFERLVYPMTRSQVFNIILDQIPDLLNTLSSDEDEEMKKIFYSFCGLIKTFLGRFLSTTWKNESYKKVKAALSKYPESMYIYPVNCPVWNPKPKHKTKIQNLLECPVCYERFVTPIMACENGHCICSNCKEQINNCPICRAKFSNIRMTIMDQIIEVTEFHCKNFDSGCDVKLLYKDIWDHEMDCEYRTVSCDIVTCQNPPKLICNEEVILANFHKHIEKCHTSYVTKFDLNSKRKVELKRQKTKEVRLLKDFENNLHFIERIYVTDGEIFFSYHYVGKSSDANNYVYTIKITGRGFPQAIKYSNFCLPNYMGIFDTESDKRCLILESEKIFDPLQTYFEYSVKIEDINSYRLKQKKNKDVFSV